MRQNPSIFRYDLRPEIAAWWDAITDSVESLMAGNLLRSLHLP